MFGILKKIFLVLLTNIVNGFNHTKRVSLSNQKGINDNSSDFSFSGESDQEQMFLINT